jgi:hypothetical protein
MKPLREKAFDLQSCCLKDLQRDGAFSRDMHWLLPRAKRLMKLANGYLPNGNRTPGVERLWLGTFTPDTIELILQEDVHRDLMTSQYSRYCKVITEMTKVRILVAESMIAARYQHYYDDRRRSRAIQRRLLPPKKTGTRRQQKLAPLGQNQKRIDAMFLPERPSQCSLRRIASYRALQAQMRDKRAHRLLKQPLKTMTQHRILILPPRRVPVPAIISGDVTAKSIVASNVPTSDHAAYRLGRLITTTYHNLVSYANIELDRDSPLHIHSVDKSLGLDAHDVRDPARQRDG